MEADRAEGLQKRGPIPASLPREPSTARRARNEPPRSASRRWPSRPRTTRTSVGARDTTRCETDPMRKSRLSPQAPRTISSAQVLSAMRTISCAGSPLARTRVTRTGKRESRSPTRSMSVSPRRARGASAPTRDSGFCGMTWTTRISLHFESSIDQSSEPRTSPRAGSSSTQRRIFIRQEPRGHFPRRLLDREYRDFRVSDYSLGDAPQKKVVRPAQAPRPHYDQLGLLASRGLENFLDDASFGHDDLARALIELGELVPDEARKLRMELEQFRDPTGVERRVHRARYHVLQNQMTRRRPQRLRRFDRFLRVFAEVDGHQDRIEAFFALGDLGVHRHRHHRTRRLEDDARCDTSQEELPEPGPTVGPHDDHVGLGLPYPFQNPFHRI